MSASLRHVVAQDRTSYRVCCRGPTGEQVFDLYHIKLDLILVVSWRHVLQLEHLTFHFYRCPRPLWYTLYDNGHRA